MSKLVLKTEGIAEDIRTAREWVRVDDRWIPWWSIGWVMQSTANAFAGYGASWEERLQKAAQFVPRPLVREASSGDGHQASTEGEAS